MNFNLIKIDNILIEQKNDNNYTIKYKNSKKEIKPLVVKIPLIYIPFGIDKEYNSYYIKGQLRKTKNIKNNNEQKLFLEFIEQLEKLLYDQIKIEINSQIRYSKDYDPIIIFKILKTSKSGITTQVTQNNSYFNFFKITKHMSFNGNIIIDSIWLYNNKINYKMKLTNIDISV